MRVVIHVVQSLLLSFATSDVINLFSLSLRVLFFLSSSLCLLKLNENECSNVIVMTGNKQKKRRNILQYVKFFFFHNLNVLLIIIINIYIQHEKEEEEENDIKIFPFFLFPLDIYAQK